MYWRLLLTCQCPCPHVCLNAGVTNGASGNNPYADPGLTADYIVSWVQGANDTYGLDIDYGTAGSDVLFFFFRDHIPNPRMHACYSGSSRVSACMPELPLPVSPAKAAPGDVGPVLLLFP